MSVDQTFTPADLFAEIGPRTFDDYRVFESTVSRHFNAHVLDLPAGYRLRDAMAWALRHGVVRRTDGAIMIAPRELSTLE